MKNNRGATASNSTLYSLPTGYGVARGRDIQSDMHSSSKTVVGRLMYLQGIMHQSLNAALASCDLTYYEYSVLAALRGAGESWALSPSTLKTTLLFTSGGLSNLLKRLEKRQFITRANNPQDGRSVLVHLTLQGKCAVDEAAPRLAAAEMQLVGRLNARDRTSLARLLNRMSLDLGW